MASVNAGGDIKTETAADMTLTCTYNSSLHSQTIINLRAAS